MADETTNQGGETQGGQPQGQPQGGQNPPGYENLLARYNGDGGAVAVLLYQENYQLRDRLRQAQASSAPQGGAVLSAEEAQAWQAYRQLGDHGQVQQRLGEAEALRNERDQLRRDNTLRDVAAASGYRFSVLRDLDQRAGGLHYEIADGAVTVRAANAEASTAQPLADYAAAQWADYLPALAPTNGQPPTGQTSGTPYPAQTGNQSPTKATPAATAADYLKRRYKGPPTPAQ